MRWTTRLSTMIVLLGILMASALALPAGPNSISGEIDYRLSTYAPQSNNALAGNITELNFDAWTITRTWQGYFGNITGTIVLADQYNNTLYDWSNTNPNGRIYASRNQTVDWSTIACANKTTILDGTEAQFTLTNETDRLGNYPIDSVNNTFTTSTDNQRTDGVTTRTVQWANYSTFWVGPVEIKGTGDLAECYSAVLHNSSAWVNGNQGAQNDASHWREIALADNNGTGNMVYTSILEQNYAGFDGKPHDFEMLVGENGHGTDTATSTYWFYVELE